MEATEGCSFVLLDIIPVLVQMLSVMILYSPIHVACSSRVLLGKSNVSQDTVNVSPMSETDKLLTR